MYVGTTPQPLTVTTRILPFLVGNPYKPSFVTVTGWGVNLKYMITQYLSDSSNIPRHKCLKRHQVAVVNFGPLELLSVIHPHFYLRDNGGGPLGMLPLIINPIYTLDHVGIYWVPIPHLKGSRGGLNSPPIFPMILQGSPRFPVNSFSTELLLIQVIPKRTLQVGCLTEFCTFLHPKQKFRAGTIKNMEV